MQTTSYFLSVIASSLGIAAGIMISTSAKEELKKGKDYFVILKKALLAASTVLILNIIGAGTTIKLLAYVAAIALLYIEMNNIIIYSLLGLMIFLASPSQKSLIIITSMVFIIGIAEGSILTANNRKLGIKSLLGKGVADIFPLLLSAFALGIIL
ncbi:hypothetical protein HYU11_00785 [Candidatus Woesearchaeota archaeon]|nr:hypothetical protein [Candidatus Woesearchaeota archaeon]